MAHTEDNETTAVMEAEAPPEAPANRSRAPRKKKEVVAKKRLLLPPRPQPSSRSPGA
jgi:hypothetical protein